MEAQQPGHEPMPASDANFAGGSFVHYNASHSIFKNQFKILFERQRDIEIVQYSPPNSWARTKPAEGPCYSGSLGYSGLAAKPGQ